MLNLPDKTPKTDEELRQAMLKLGIDPALMEDLKDLLALKGAGSFTRQSKAHIKQTAAELSIFWLPIVLVVVCAGAVSALFGVVTNILWFLHLIGINLG